jgi:hypothetical protein
MSTSITATSYFVYGKPTMRLSAVGVVSSDGLRRTGNHANGLAAAMSVMGASSSPSARRSSSGVRPRWARRPMSNKANVSQAWNTSWLTSAGWNGASNGKGGGSGCRKLHIGFRPSRFMRRLVASASPPHTSARSYAPSRMDSPAFWTSCCGVVPPIPEYSE